MSVFNTPDRGTRLPATLVETQIFTGVGCVMGIFPEQTTAGTITLRDAASIGTGNTPVHVNASGLTQQGVYFGPRGFSVQNGLTVQCSSVADRPLIVWDKGT